MPRQKKILETISRRECLVLEEVKESTTLRQNLSDGRIIRTDGKGFWICQGYPRSKIISFYGYAPRGWNRRFAYYEDFSRSYEVEADYS